MPKDITPPRRGFSFKDFSLSKPGQALPGDRLDTELDRLAGKFGDLEAFLLASFERDGSLKGNTIAQRHLTPGVFEPIVQRFHDAILKAQKDLALREKSTQNMAVEARLAKTDAAKAAQEAKDAVQEARSVNLQTHQAAQNANQARARAEAALIPLAATQSDAQTAANSARIAEDMAYRWAEKTDGPVFVPNGGDPVNDGFYSSKFWALFTKSTVENGSYWYLGASDTPPTTGNDGQPLQEGMWYFDTDQGQTFIWNGTLWEPISGAQGSVLSVFGRQGAVTAHANDYAAYYLTLTGGTLTGMLTLSASPTALLHASTKGYTDQQDTALDASLRAFIAAEDDALEATLRAFVVSEDDALEATLRAYTDAQVATRLTKAQADALYLSLLGGTLTGPLTLPGDPTQDLQAATKGYVDALVGDIPPGTSVGDAPPPTPEQGQLWYKTSAPVGLYVWYVDPDSSQWVATNGGGSAPDTSAAPGNRIINGSFDVWQRGTSSAANGYVAADRWYNAISGGAGATVAQSRGDFPLGSMLGRNNPKHFLRQAVSGLTLASHFAITQHRIEDVRTFAGQKVTVLGWARRSGGAGNMTLEGEQNFGTGGSPSTNVTGIGAVLIPLTVDWEPFAVVMDFPSLAGKALGTNNNDFLALNFWAAAGSDWDARSLGLGLQTITVDLWGVHTLLGEHFVEETDNYFAPDPADEIAKCLRYYESGQVLMQAPASGYYAVGSQFSVAKRKSPSLTHAIISGTGVNTISPQSVTKFGFNFNGQGTAAGSYATIEWYANAEIL